MHHSRHQAPELTYERCGPGLKPEALRACHVAQGHPEGYRDAFATIYEEAADAIVSRRLGQAPERSLLDMPTVFDGVPDDEIRRGGACLLARGALDRLRAGGLTQPGAAAPYNLIGRPVLADSIAASASFCASRPSRPLGDGGVRLATASMKWSSSRR